MMNSRLFVTINTDRDLELLQEQITKNKIVTSIAVNPDYPTVLIVNLQTNSHQEIGKLADELTQHASIQHVQIVYGKLTASTHMFFDIDGTLTSSRSQEPVDAQVQSVFDDYSRFLPRTYKYLATGRDEGTVRELMSKLKVEKYAVVENGGIIIGPYEGGSKKPGSKEHPNRFNEFLISKGIVLTEDGRQRNRDTEIVCLASVQWEKMLELQAEARKQGIMVCVLRGGSTYHITKEGIDKGSGIAIISGDRGWGKYDRIISIGDSELDIPMFKQSYRSYLRGIANDEIQKIAKTIPSCKILPKAPLVENLYQVLDDLGVC